MGQKDPLGRKWQPTPVFLPGKFHGQRSLASYSPWGRKESDTAEHSLTHSLTRLVETGLFKESGRSAAGIEEGWNQPSDPPLCVPGLTSTLLT